MGTTPTDGDDALIEHGFDCPYCGGPFTMLVDASLPDQRYVEDCEVCCNPIDIHVRATRGAVVRFEAEQGL